MTGRNCPDSNRSLKLLIIAWLCRGNGKSTDLPGSSGVTSAKIGFWLYGPRSVDRYAPRGSQWLGSPEAAIGAVYRRCVDLDQHLVVFGRWRRNLHYAHHVRRAIPSVHRGLHIRTVAAGSRLASSLAERFRDRLVLADLAVDIGRTSLRP